MRKIQSRFGRRSICGDTCDIPWNARVEWCRRLIVLAKHGWVPLEKSPRMRSFGRRTLSARPLWLPYMACALLSAPWRNCTGRSYLCLRQELGFNFVDTHVDQVDNL